MRSAVNFEAGGQRLDILGLQQALDEKAANLPGAWQNIPLASGWSNLGTGFATPQCRKLVGNLIEVKGTIRKATAVNANEIIATLPVGYRPADTRHFVTWGKERILSFASRTLWSD